MDRKMSEKKNKREWIKTAAIVFLSIMLVLTFFSNTIMNYSLPVVATQYVQSGSITAKIRGTGVIEGTDPYVVKMEEDVAAKKISSIEIRKGDHVEEGQVLLKFSSQKVSGQAEAEAAVRAAQDAYNAVVKELEGAVLKGQLTNEKKNQILKGSTGKYEDYLTTVNAIDAQLKDMEGQLTEYNAALAQCNLYLSLNSQDAQIDKETAKSSAAEAETVYNQAAAALDAAKKKITELETSIASSTDADTVAALNAELAQVKASIAGLEADATAKKSDWDGKAAYYQKAVTYEQQANLKLQYEYLIQVSQQNITTAKTNKDTITNNVDTENMYYQKVKTAKDALKEAKDKLDELSGEGEISELLAPVSGTVDELFFKSGEEVSAGQQIANIQPDGKGYTLSISVTNEQARNVSVGDPAELVNAWFYYDINVVLASIRPDKTDPGKKKLLTFDVTGDVTSGQSLSVSVGQRSANYDLIVPNSAIREDNNGKFVLIVESKSSPLGNRYVATRVDVQVVASDDVQSAVTGALNGWEYVITTANKPVEAGKLVRLSEE